MFDAFSRVWRWYCHRILRTKLSKGRRVILKKGRDFKTRRLALAMAVAMASGRGYALGLGDIELHSALNQPLNAEVRLLAENPGELKNAVVKLAPGEEFARAGIERSAILSDLDFTIITVKDGASVVKITSTQPIREPFLDFVVQIDWQSGRLLREYTVLLDPPMFGEEKAAPIAASETAPNSDQKPVSESEPVSGVIVRQSSPVSTTRETRRSVSIPLPGGLTKSATDGGRGFGPTERNNTLWSIANSVRPDDSVSVYQMMMALLKNNPEAFYNNNVNGLKAGYVLRVPEKSVVAAVNEAEAVREAARQDEIWQRIRRGGVASSANDQGLQSVMGQAPADRGVGNVSTQEKDTARLRLVAPSDASTVSAGGMQAELDKLRSELAIALESSDSAKSESEELQSRVTALEGQINSLQRLLTLKDQALSDMQKRSGLAVPPEAQAPAQTPESPAEPAKSIAKPAPAKPTPKAVEKPSLDLSANPTLIGAAVGVTLLLLSVVWLIVRRRRTISDSAEDSEQFEPDIAETAVPADNFQFAREEQEEPAMEGSNDNEMNQVAEEVAQHVEQDIPQTTSDLDVMHTPEGDIDPIVEADVYLAYRRYQQAESLIQSALERQPHRLDLQGKLLEIYYAAKNAGAFQTLAKTLFTNLGSNSDDPLWQRILPMGRELCPDYELFATSADGDDEQKSASTGDALFNERAGLASEQSSAGNTSDDAHRGDAQESYDLNLGTARSSAAPEEEKMDFDLNLGDDAATTENSPESSRSFSESFGAKEDETAAGDRDASTAGADSEPPQARSHNLWEIDSAISDFDNIDFGLDDSDLLAGTDVVGTKLDLARAYIDMGDNDSATDILKEVTNEGNEQQKQEAKTLMEKIA